MLHSIISIIFILCIAAIFLAYIYFFRFSIHYIVKIIVNRKKFKYVKEIFFIDVGFKHTIKNKLLFHYLVVLIISLGVYIFEWNRFVDSKSSYIDAKKYFVAGMVLMDFRTLGHTVIYPERLIWKPAVWTQELITHAGLHLIPESDGERAIWAYHFILAPFVNFIHAPRTEEVYELIKTTEYILDAIAAKKIADHNFNEKNKYIVYSFSLFYYQYSYDLRYSLRGGPEVYYEGLYKDRKQVEYMKKVVEHALILENEWNKYEYVNNYFNKNYEDGIIYLAAISLLIHEIIYYQIHNFEFACNDRYVLLYYEYVSRYVAMSKKVNEKLKRQLDHPVILHGDKINFFGHRLCNFPILPGYNIRSVPDLGGEGPGWYKAFVKLNKKLVPEEKQQEVLDRFEQFGGEVLPNNQPLNSSTPH